METTVKTYKKPKDYERGLIQMQKANWRLVNVVSQKTRGGCLTALSGKTIMVATFERPIAEPPAH